MRTKYMYVKLIRVWSRYNVGDVIRFGYSKGESRIREGFGIEVPKQKAVNVPVVEKPVVETADANPIDEPETETAEVTPKKGKKTNKKDMPSKTGDAYKDARNK